MKRIVALFFAVILLACIGITAYADVYIEYCPVCEQNTMWRDAVRQYTSGSLSREDAIAAFKQNVADNLDVEVN